jgi:hypothetical protein
MSTSTAGPGRHIPTGCDPVGAAHASRSASSPQLRPCDRHPAPAAIQTRRPQIGRGLLRQPRLPRAPGPQADDPLGPPRPPLLVPASRDPRLPRRGEPHHRPSVSGEVDRLQASQHRAQPHRHTLASDAPGPGASGRRPLRRRSPATARIGYSERWALVPFRRRRSFTPGRPGGRRRDRGRHPDARHSVARPHHRPHPGGCDRLIHGSHRIELCGESQRKLRAAGTGRRETGE